LATVCEIRPPCRRMAGIQAGTSVALFLTSNTQRRSTLCVTESQTANAAECVVLQGDYGDVVRSIKRLVLPDPKPINSAINQPPRHDRSDE